MSNEKISVGVCLHNTKQLNAIIEYLGKNNLTYKLGEIRPHETEGGTWRGRMLDTLVDTDEQVQALKAFALSIKVIALTDDEEDEYLVADLEEYLEKKDFMSDFVSEEETEKVLNKARELNNSVNKKYFGNSS